MQKPLAGLNVAILVANGFHEIEMTTFQRALLEAGASPKIISVESSLAHGWQGKGWGHYHPVDKHLSDALAADYDVLLVPSGHRGHEKLKQTAHTRRFIGGFMMAFKPVLAMGDAVKMMAELGVIKGMMVCAPEEAQPVLSQNNVIVSENSPTIHSNLMSVLSEGDNIQESVASFIAFVENMMAESEDGNNAQQAA
ncbi:MAG: DJ-1/PfpI family protein [Alphaproteobacteria bacterium]|nr:DJ-1/PfpI family protein [Alphaproteobacteria bacterium]